VLGLRLLYQCKMAFLALQVIEKRLTDQVI